MLFAKRISLLQQLCTDCNYHEIKHSLHLHNLNLNWLRIRRSQLHDENDEDENKITQQTQAVCLNRMLENKTKRREEEKPGNAGGSSDVATSRTLHEIFQSD
jgi:hypothetical protein